MPHLQAGKDADASSVVSVEQTPHRVSETPPIMTATKKQSLEIKGEDSYDSDDAQQTPSAKKQVITPPPAEGGSPPSSPKPTKGPILSIFGDRRLFSSPIQVKKRTREDESKEDSRDESSSDSQQEEQEKTTPAAQSPSIEKLNKEEKDQEDDSSVPAKKPRIASSPEPTKSQDQGSLQARKPIISPTSSNENKEDDESTSQLSYGSAQPYYGRQAFRYPHHPSPHHSPYHHPHHSPYGGHSYHQYPPPAYNMYGGMYPPHHPPPHGHYAAPPPHPNMYYPQYHHPHYPPRHAMMSPIRVAQRQFPMRRTVSAPTSDASQASTKSSPAPSPSPSDCCKEASIASVTEWQRTSVSTGRPPSAKRCIPLNDPIPSKCWGPSDTNKDVKLPEFHRIVNYPDYLAKARGGSSAETVKSAAEGKKHCVMCGEPRYSSASSLANKGRTTTLKSEAETEHIIPRQNKGLCTACDVTVWIMTENGGTEIKWCKGCKNFRPWAAFGEKGSATKCTKCRERQKEKYALQKDATKQQQQRKWESSSLEESHLEAANGLRSLIHAATAN